jgi:ABC-type glutathione transport system ATPase component
MRNPDARLLSVRNLTTGFDQDGRFAPAVIDVSFHVEPGETLCLVGESGSGKSLTALSIMGLIQSPGRIAAGTILFNARGGSRDLLRLSEREMQEIRGGEIGLVFQEPMTALNPVFTIGNQIEETLRIHGRATRSDAREKSIELLRSVSVPEPERRVRDYPHQLSGGLRQRALIALALACQPALLIADEPTANVDDAMAMELVGVLKDIWAGGTTVMLATHQARLAQGLKQRTLVLDHGHLVKDG